MTQHLVEDWTVPLQFTLLINDAIVDLSAYSVPVLHLQKKDGTYVSTAGKVAWVDATIAKVQYSPADGDLLAADSPYTARFALTDSNAKVSFHPNEAADVWLVGTK